MAHRRRRLLIIGTSALLLAAGVFVLTRTVLRPGPADVASAYLDALQKRDYSKAFDLLSEESKKAIGGPDKLGKTSLGAIFDKEITSGFELGETQVSGDRATVEVHLTRDGPEVVVKVSAIKERGRWHVET